MDIQGYRKSIPARGDSMKKHMGEEIQGVFGENDKRFESQHSPSTCIRQDGKMWSLPTRSSHVSREVARESVAAVFGVDHGHFSTPCVSFMGPSSPRKGSQCVSSRLNYVVEFS